MPTGTTGNTMAPLSSHQSGNSTVDIPRQRGGSPSAVRPKASRLLNRTGSTPGRLTLLMAVLAFLALASGVAGVADVVSRDDLIDGVSDGSGRLGLAALEVYQSLSDADATATSAFLAGGVESPELRDRYDEDINRASIQLATAAASITTQAGADAVARLSADLPVYTGLIENARTYNQQGLPVGAAYLREASGLMRDRLLPAAQELQDTAGSQLAETQDSAATLPWIALAFILLTLGVLAFTQIDLTKRTNRVFNVGLLASTVAMVLVLGWLGVASFLAAGHIDSGRESGSAQIERLAEARIAALQARSAESVTLIARGGKSAADYEAVFVTQMGILLDGGSGPLAKAREANTDPELTPVLDQALATAQAWQEVHTTLRGDDQRGEYTKAVELALSTDEGGAAKLSRQLDDLLAQAIQSAGDHFRAETKAASNALTGAGIGVGLLAVVCLAGSANGLQRRIAEYR
ncbi:hypothetical protein AB0I28_03680 [Phytomonospora sp. NPDC050363]|uniref:hypothetical protein n=1 Tax=Phytomonospora sp. NPDC050363 TaxID=3155642 RepID=UPI003400D144